jgi:hypothetical protein
LDDDVGVPLGDDAVARAGVDFVDEVTSGCDVGCAGVESGLGDGVVADVGVGAAAAR